MHKTLSSIVQKGSSSIKLSEVSSSGKYPVFGAAGLVGYLDTFQTDIESVAVIKDGAGVGRSQIIPPNSSVLGTIQLIKPNKGFKASYIKYLIDSMHLGNAYTGATIPHIYFKDYGKKRIPDHSEIERNNVCRVLDGIVDEMKLSERQIAFLEEQVKSLFIEMFGEIDNTRFPIMCIEDLCDFVKDGTHQTPTYTDDHTNGFKFLSSKDVTTGKINWTNIKYIPKELHEVLYKAIKPQRNDILLAKNGTTGIAAIVDNDEIFDIYVSLALLRFKPAYNPKYMLCAINNDNTKKQFDASLKGVGVPNLHLGEIRKTKLIVPPIDLQNAFVDHVEQIDKLRFMCLMLPLDVPKMHDYALERQQL